MKKNLAVIGGGLIGGSLAAALRKRDPKRDVICFDVAEALPAIEESRVFERVLPITDVSSGLRDRDVVVIATSVDNILEQLDTIGPFLKDGAVVTDVGSTKTAIGTRAAESLPSNIHFIGGHPITGSEKSGIGAADPTLFVGKSYVLCPLRTTSEDAFLQMLNLVEELGGVPLSMDPEEHDTMLSMVSHLPQLVSIALMHAATKTDAAHGLLHHLAGPGFRDMTRLSGSSFDVWQSILASNQNSVKSALDAFRASLDALEEAIAKGDQSLWERAAKERNKLDLSSR